jgi:hypothetical protein
VNGDKEEVGYSGKREERSVRFTGESEREQARLSEREAEIRKARTKINGIVPGGVAHSLP